MSDLDFLVKKIHIIFITILFLVLYLVYKDPLNDIFLLVSLICLFSFAKSILEELSIKRILLIGLAFFMMYSIVVWFLFLKDYDMNLVNNKTNIIKQETAVLIVYEGESALYELPKEITNSRIQTSLATKLKMPLNLYKRRIMYNNIGKSDYRHNTERVKEKVENILSDEYSVHLGYMKDSIYIEEAVFNIVNEGYNKIIIVPIFLTENNIVDDLKARIEKLKLYNLNIQITYTEPLWDSEIMCELYSMKIISMIKDKRAKDTGVVLIGEGIKNFENELFIKAVKQDLMFRKKVKEYLVSNSELEETRINLSWFSGIEPDYIEEIRKMLEYGIGEILCIYNKPATTNIDNYVIARKIKEKVDMPDGVQIRIIDGFLYEDFFVSEISKRIEFQNLQKWE